MEEKRNPSSIDEYISQYSQEIQDRLQSMRKIIRDAAPEAAEKISWGMPTFTLNRNLVHFAVHKNHIGFYPGVTGIEFFQEKLSEYKYSKGAVQFPNSKPLPFDLIREIVTFRVSEEKSKDS